MKDNGTPAAAPAFRRVRVEVDSHPENPRRLFDTVGVMVCLHRRYRLGDSHGYRERDFSGWAELRDRLRAHACAGVLLPLYLMDHSGISLAVDPAPFAAADGMGWDWGQVGFVYARKGAASEAPAGSRRGPKLRDWIRRVLLEEVRVYDAYLRGEVYGYVAEVSDGGGVWEETDSCWGYYGDDADSGLGGELARFAASGYDIVRR